MSEPPRKRLSKDNCSLQFPSLHSASWKGDVVMRSSIHTGPRDKSWHLMGFRRASQSQGYLSCRLRSCTKLLCLHSEKQADYFQFCLASEYGAGSTNSILPGSSNPWILKCTSQSLLWHFSWKMSPNFLCDLDKRVWFTPLTLWVAHECICGGYGYSSVAEPHRDYHSAHSQEKKGKGNTQAHLATPCSLSLATNRPSPYS